MDPVQALLGIKTTHLVAGVAGGAVLIVGVGVVAFVIGAVMNRRLPSRN